MPKKIKALLKDLMKAGFIDRGGKGSHRNFEHACGYRLTVAVHSGEAKNYQEKDIAEALKAAAIWEQSQ